MTDTFYLYKSGRKDKKFAMRMGEPYNHLHNFGSRGMRDRTLINNKKSRFYIEDDKERKRIIQGYKNRHRTDNIDDVHAPGALSWFILWDGDTLEEGIKAYEKRFKVNVIDKTDIVYKKNMK
tara:strand:+ start:1707 stop:2072 length:366 start_codon:yes stop_codon:yes gene_type:complete